MPEKATVRDYPIEGKRVLVRVDFNVPFEPGTNRVSDDSRIRAALPTIAYLRERGARVIIASHLGRPKGTDESLRMTPVANRLAEILGTAVSVAPDCVGAATESEVAQLAPGGILLLENLRFHQEEERNDSAFAQELARLANVFVNDAFGTAHRAHASTEGITHHLPAVAGLLMEAELRMLGLVLESPPKPLALLMGGAKVGDKLAVMRNLVPHADLVLVGGGMAAAFLAARGLGVGASLIEPDGPEVALAIDSAAREHGTRLMVPTDVVVAASIGANVLATTIPVEMIADDAMLLDIGPDTRASYARALRECRTILWNGPMGVFEFDSFARGTAEMATVLAEQARSGATVIVGGGSTAEAVHHFEVAEAMTHVSTGGGAALEFLEGRVLPGVAALLDKPL